MWKNNKLILLLFIITFGLTGCGDSTPPTATITNSEFEIFDTVNEEDIINTMVSDVEDDVKIDPKTAVKLVNYSDIDFSIAGEYQVDFIITDTAGNELTSSGTLSVVDNRRQYLKEAKSNYNTQIEELANYSLASKVDIKELKENISNLTVDNYDQFQSDIDDYNDQLVSKYVTSIDNLISDVQKQVNEVSDSRVASGFEDELNGYNSDSTKLAELSKAYSGLETLLAKVNSQIENEEEKVLAASRPSSISSNSLVSIDSCSLSGSRVANAKVDIGYDSSYANRDYYSYTNSAAQVVYVEAAQIILQNDDKENSGEDRYCSDEAKVPGVEASDLDEGHIIADSLGGVSNAYNITPQESSLNRYGTQSDIEQDIRDNGGATNFIAEITYPSTSTQIPNQYYISYYVNGQFKEFTFNNDYEKDSETSNNSSNNSTNSSNSSGSNVYYQNCTAVRDAGAAPIYDGDPGYSSKLDRDGDGVACE